jgi:hypothetical protein
MTLGAERGTPVQNFGEITYRCPHSGHDPFLSHFPAKETA